MLASIATARPSEPIDIFHLDPPFRLLGHRRWNKPFDQYDLHGIIHDQARNHRITEYCKHLLPWQWRKARRPTSARTVPTSASAVRAAMRLLLGIVAQNQRRSRADTTENTAK